MLVCLLYREHFPTRETSIDLSVDHKLYRLAYALMTLPELKKKKKEFKETNIPIKIIINNVIMIKFNSPDLAILRKNQQADINKDSSRKQYVHKAIS